MQVLLACPNQKKSGKYTTDLCLDETHIKKLWISFTVSFWPLSTKSQTWQRFTFWVWWWLVGWCTDHYETTHALFLESITRCESQLSTISTPSIHEKPLILIVTRTCAEVKGENGDSLCHYWLQSSEKYAFRLSSSYAISPRHCINMSFALEILFALDLSSLNSKLHDTLHVRGRTLFSALAALYSYCSDTYLGDFCEAWLCSCTGRHGGMPVMTVIELWLLSSNYDCCHRIMIAVIELWLPLSNYDCCLSQPNIFGIRM